MKKILFLVSVFVFLMVPSLMYSVDLYTLVITRPGSQGTTCIQVTDATVVGGGIFTKDGQNEKVYGGFFDGKNLVIVTSKDAKGTNLAAQMFVVEGNKMFRKGIMQPGGSKGDNTELNVIIYKDFSFK